MIYDLFHLCLHMLQCNNGRSVIFFIEQFYWRYLIDIILFAEMSTPIFVHATGDSSAHEKVYLASDTPTLFGFYLSQRILARKAYPSASIQARQWCASSERSTFQPRFFNTREYLPWWQDYNRWGPKNPHQKGNTILCKDTPVVFRFYSCEISLSGGSVTLFLLVFFIYDIL